VTNFILNCTIKRFLAICQLLTQPLFARRESICSVAIDKHEIRLEHKTWGLLATLKVSAFTSSKSLLTVHFPEYPGVAEVETFRTALVEELKVELSDLHRIKDSEFGDQHLVNLSNDLYQIRSEQSDYVLKWFFDGLRIWGIETLDQPQKLTVHDKSWDLRGKRNRRIQKPKAAFDFMILGAPAEFAVMARESIGRKSGVSCTILNPGTHRKLLEIPVGINPIGVQFQNKDSSIDLIAHKLLNGNTLLKVVMTDNERGWGLWNTLRDEMERLGWFSISCFENTSSPDLLETNQNFISEVSVATNDIEHLPENNESKKETHQIWSMIPDKGWDRECLRLWHRGLTCKDIGNRLKKTDKTIRNRLNLLRKNFGEQAVPYRKGNCHSD